MTDKKINSAPRVAPAFRVGGGVSRWVGQTILGLMGWRVEGEPPNVAKCVIIASPHTSNWDLILAFGTILSRGMPIRFMMKKEAFFFPFGGLFKRLGGMPIDRSSRNNVVEQMAKAFSDADVLWVAITPEGTRGDIKAYRKGYLRIAEAADVPVFLFGVDAPRKTLVLDRYMETTGDDAADAAAHLAYVTANYTGMKPRGR